MKVLNLTLLTTATAIPIETEKKYKQNEKSQQVEFKRIIASGRLSAHKRIFFCYFHSVSCFYSYLFFSIAYFVSVQRLSYSCTPDKNVTGSV